MWTSFLTWLSPYTIWLKIAGIVLVAAVVGFLVWKWKDMENTIANDANVIAGWQSDYNNEKNINKKLEADIAAKNKINTNLANQLKQSQQNIDNLTDQLAKIQFDQNVITKPGQVEQQANDIFNQVWNCISSSTGAANATCTETNSTSSVIAPLSVR